MLRYRCAFHIGTVALRREAFDAVGGFDPSLRGLKTGFLVEACFPLFCGIGRRSA